MHDDEDSDESCDEDGNGGVATRIVMMGVAMQACVCVRVSVASPRKAAPFCRGVLCALHPKVQQSKQVGRTDQVNVML